MKDCKEVKLTHSPAGGLPFYGTSARSERSALYFLGLPSGSDGKESACNEGDSVRSLGWEDPLEKGTSPGGEGNIPWRRRERLPTPGVAKSWT